MLASVFNASRQRPVEGKKQFPEWEETCAVACAVHNMALLATTLKVAGYWSSWCVPPSLALCHAPSLSLTRALTGRYAHYRASDEMVTEIGLDPNMGDRCLGVFVLGQPKPDLVSRAARLPLEEIATWQ